MVTKTKLSKQKANDEEKKQELVQWILEDGLQVRLNLQLHKIIRGADASGG